MHRGAGVGRVLDDDRGVAAEHQRGLGVTIVGEAHEEYDTGHEPVPFAKKVEEQVDQVDLGVVFLCHYCLLLQRRNEVTIDARERPAPTKLMATWPSLLSVEPLGCTYIMSF